MTKISVGIDIGTTAVKLIALDTNAQVVFSDQISHDVISENPGWAEENPQIWWNNTCVLMDKLTKNIQPGRIVSIGCVGMVPTLILLDEKGETLGLSIQQNDIRAAKELENITENWNIPDYFERTGTLPNSQHIYPKLKWLSSHKRNSFSKCQTIMGSYDFIVYQLTGKFSIEQNWALESGMWDFENSSWIKEVLRTAGITEDNLPPVHKSTDIVGSIKQDLAEKWGLSTDVRVIAGSADHVASAFSTGAKNTGDLVIKLGGAGDILAYSEQPVCDNRLFLDYHPVGKSFLPNGCMAASGAALKWFKNVFSSSDFVEMDNQAVEVPPGSDGLVVLPYFLGEKTPIFDTNARGVIYGLTLAHTKPHIFRAFLESIAYAFRHHVDVMKEAGIPIKRGFITNGGSKSTLWRQILADVLGMDLTYVKNHPGSSLGGAVLAGMAVKIWGEEIIDTILKNSIQIKHNSDTQKLYEKPYHSYRNLYPRLKDHFQENCVSIDS